MSTQRGGDGDASAVPAVRARRDPPRRRRRRRLILVGAIGACLATTGAVWWRFLRPPPLEGLEKARLALVAGDHASAAALAEEEVAERPDDARARFILGAAQLGTGREAEGEANLLEAVRLNPRLPGGRLALARFYASKGRLDDALANAARATEPEASALKARLRERRGDLAGAADAYDDAIAAGVRDLAVLEAAIQTAQRLRRSGDGRAARHDTRLRALRDLLRSVTSERLAAAPGDASALAALARVAEAEGSAPPRELEAAYRKALAANPGDVDLTRGLAALLRRAGRAREAEALLADVASRTADPLAAVALAEHLDRAGQAGQAVEVVRAAVEKHPDDPALRASLAAALAASGHAEDARAEMDRAVAEHPRHARLLEVAGDLAATRGDRDAARDLYARASAARPEDVRLLRKEILPQVDALVAALAAGGALPPELEAAERRIADLRRAAPNDPDGLRWAAAVAWARGAPGDAGALLDHLLRLFPEDPLARTLLAHVRLSSGEGDPVRAEMARVLGAPAASAESHATAARLALDAGRGEEAVLVAEAGLAHHPGDAVLAALLGRALLAAGRPAEFVERLARLPETVREKPEVRRANAWCLARTGRSADAERSFRASLTQGADGPRARAEFARLLVATGRAADAEALLREAREADRDSPELAVEMGLVLLERGAREEAGACFSAAAAAEPPQREAMLRCAEFHLTAPPGDAAAVGAIREIEARLQRVPGGPIDALYVRGLALLREGDATGAADALGRHARLRPTSFETRFHRATALVTAGRRDEAALELRVALALRPDATGARQRLALLLFDAAVAGLGGGDAEAARSASAALVELAPDHQPSRLLLGVSALRLGRADVTETQARELLRVRPDDAAAHFLVALAAAARGDRAGVTAALDRVVELEPDAAAMRVLRAFARLDAGDPAGALSDLDAAQQAGGAGPWVRYGRAHAHLAAGRPADADAEARSAVADHPDVALSHRLLGEVAFARGDRAGAAAALRRAFELDRRDAGPLVAAAALLVEAGALDAAEAALADAPSDAPAVLHARGDVQRARGHVDEAAALYRAAASGGHTRAHLALADLAETRGDRAATLAEVGLAVAAGQHEPAVRFRHGVLLLAAGRRDEARAAFEAVLAARPDHVPALNNLALALAGGLAEPGSTEALDAALAHARHAREVAPSDARVADTLGWVLVLAGRADEAVPLLEESLRARPQDAEVAFHLGVALSRAGRDEEAQRHLRAALAAAPDAPWAGDARALLGKR